MNNSLAAVASRIQERNNALCSELATLDLLQTQHGQAQQTLKADECASTEVRKELLTAVRSRHGLELECLQIKNDSQMIDETISQLQSSTKDIRTKTKELEHKFDEEHAPIYAKHDLSTKLYSMQSEATLVTAQRKKQRRETKLQSLKEQIERQNRESIEMRTECERIRDEWNELECREEEDDEETVSLSMQIKSVLAKKASLRAALNDGKEMQQTAKSNRETWERRCVEGH